MIWFLHALTGRVGVCVRASMHANIFGKVIDNVATMTHDSDLTRHETTAVVCRLWITIYICA